MTASPPTHTHLTPSSRATSKQANPQERGVRTVCSCGATEQVRDRHNRQPPRELPSQGTRAVTLRVDLKQIVLVLQ